MCRWLAYRGRPIFLGDLVTEPEHSLIEQSLHAREAKTGTNGDGFGVGWYGERSEPGLYREILPAWSDENLRSLCRQIRSGQFFAHVRASTGTATSRANCHPFVHGRTMFMHNGQIGGYGAIRRALEALVPDGLFAQRQGTTDSELIFLLALAEAAPFPVALARVLSRIEAAMDRAAITEPLRFTACWTDGDSFGAVRYATDMKAPSLYYCDADPQALIVVSEPLDGRAERWKAVPQGMMLTSAAAAPLNLSPFEVPMLRAA